MELPRPETSEETELEMRVWPATEKREMAGDAGADELTVSGDCGGRGIAEGDESPSMRDSFNMARECLERERWEEKWGLPGRGGGKECNKGVQDARGMAAC